MNHRNSPPPFADQQMLRLWREQRKLECRPPVAIVVIVFLATAALVILLTGVAR